MAHPAIGAPFSYRDYRGWEGRWELIEGRVYDMSPAPSQVHQAMVLALAVQLWLFFEQHPCRVFVAPFDVRLPEGDEADDEVATVVQPDLTVICDKDKLDSHGCRGAPRWIIEVIEPSTAARDQIDKLQLYERHGVRDYWLVHPFDRLVTMYRRGKDGRYKRPVVHKLAGKYKSEWYRGLKIDWDRVVAQLPADIDQ